MKKALYLLYALMLILMPLNSLMVLGEPAETKDVEPKAISSVPFNEGIYLTFLLESYAEANEAETKEEVVVEEVTVEEVILVEEENKQEKIEEVKSVEKKQEEVKVAQVLAVKPVKKEEKKVPTAVKGEKLTFEVSAYTAGAESTGKTQGDFEYGITASGKKVQKNHTIACPPSLDFGTKVYIPSRDITYVCEDRGSAITEGHLDIYMDNVEKALRFGRQQMEVIILPRDSI